MPSYEVERLGRMPVCGLILGGTPWTNESSEFGKAWFICHLMGRNAQSLGLAGLNPRQPILFSGQRPSHLPSPGQRAASVKRAKRRPG